MSHFSAARTYLAMSDDEDEVRRVVRSEKVKRYIRFVYLDK